VLFTDVVGSTELATRLGDRAWRDLLARHHAAVRRELDRWRGREVDTAGDGFLATFDGPARAIRCAVAAVESVRGIGMEIRAGSTPARSRSRTEICGASRSHIGSRVSSLAAPNEVLVSRTVADLVAGSGIVLAERGEHELRGVPGTWLVYAVESA
jgi:class 3 adenylate cyclase